MTPILILATLALAGITIGGWLKWQDARMCRWARITADDECDVR